MRNSLTMLRPPDVVTSGSSLEHIPILADAIQTKQYKVSKRSARCPSFRVG